MTQEPHHLIKHRELSFSELHPDQAQAHSACLLLSDIDGIIEVRPLSRHRLQVSYLISHLHLQLIEEALLELGFHLDNSLMSRLKRALYYYAEENERFNLGLCEDCNKQVFVSRYQRLQHGCRDRRPEHWRNYR